MASVGYALNINQLGIIQYYSYNIHLFGYPQRKKERKLDLQIIRELVQGWEVRVVTTVFT